MKKNHKLALILAALAAAIPTILLTGAYQGIATTTGSVSSAVPENAIGIDFDVYPETPTVLVERGIAASIPLKVEAPIDAEKTLAIRIAQERGSLDSSQLNAMLDKTTVTLSKTDLAEGRATDIGAGRAVRDAGILTIVVPMTVSPGTYTLGVEAEEQADGKLADAVVAGRLIYIEVK